MPIYRYNAIDANSHRAVQGKIEALDHRQAKELIRNQGHIPTEVLEHREEITVESLLKTIPIIGNMNQPTQRDLLVFTEQLATLLDSGVPLIDGLNLIENQTTNESLQKTIHKVRTDIMTGDTFSNAIARHPHVFSKLYINLMRAGESSGQLSEISNRLAFLIDNQIVLKNRINGALMMPAITSVIITLVTGGVVIFLVPQFEPIFKQAGSELPFITQVLVFVSHFLCGFWWAIFLALGGFIMWLNVYRLSPAGKPVIDQWSLTLPVFGNLVLKSSTSGFIQTLATLQGAGVALTDSLMIAADTVDNEILLTHLKHARDKILEGSTLFKPLEETNAFPPMVVKMISIGEETGNLDYMLGKAAKVLDREVTEAVNALTEMIQPAITVVIGVVLTFILIGLYLPIFQLSQNVK
ncbi:MAG: type II secretion system F family protein [Vampirovibrionales bacterium]|nr:type II secretion system F family protein [Vampirovibrionales bacterium]